MLPLTATPDSGFTFSKLDDSLEAIALRLRDMSFQHRRTGGGSNAVVKATFVATATSADDHETVNPTSMPVGGTSVLTPNIANANTSTMAGVAVSDTFPSGMQVAATPGSSNTCGGTFTATANATSVSLTGGSITANNNCSMTVNVTADHFGRQAEHDQHGHEYFR